MRLHFGDMLGLSELREMKTLSLPKKAPSDPPGDRIASVSLPSAKASAKLQPWRIVYIAFSVRVGDRKALLLTVLMTLWCRSHCATR